MDTKSIETEAAAAETAVKNFTTSHRNLVIAILVALALGIGGFAVGRYTKAPVTITKTEVKTQIQTQVKTEIQYKDRIVEKKVYVEVEKKDSHTSTTTTKKPDGTVVTTQTVDEHVDENTNVNTSKDAQHQQDTQQVATQTVVQTVVQTKLVLQQPDWSVYAGAGYSLPHVVSGTTLGIPGLNGWVVQAGVDRRLAGPFWTGLFINTQGTVGLNLRVTW
jgi:uncharacterized protein HemX